MRRRRVVVWVGTILGLGLVLFLLVRYEPGAVLRALLDSSPHVLLAIGLLLSAIQVLNAVGPVLLLGPSDTPGLSMAAHTRLFLATQPLSLIAPGKISDLGAVPLLRRAHPPGAVAGSVLLDRLATLFFLLLATPPALRVTGILPASVGTDAAVVLGLAVVVSVPVVLINARVRELANRYVLRLWPGLLRGFGAHLEAVFRRSRQRLLANFGLTILKTVLSAATIVLLATDMDLALGLGLAFWMSILVQLVSAIPISAQGLGLAEGTLVALFIANDLPGAAALAITLVSRVLLIAVLGVIYLLVTLPTAAGRMPGRPEETSEASRTEP